MKHFNYKDGLDNYMNSGCFRVNIEVIPHKAQRYETVGDYWIDKNNTVQIRVSDLGDWRYNACIAIHEFSEFVLCLDRKITESSITDFDIAYEALRKPGDTSEPGDSPDAPYKDEHFFATNIERSLALEFGIDWNDYDNKVNEL